MALGASTFNYFGSAVGDIFTGLGEEMKAQGSEIQAQQYREASKFATLESEIQAGVTTVNTAQATRQAYQGVGRAEAGIAGAGFSSGGSAGDILRSSAQQGALQAAVAKQTGQVATLGYQEEAKSYAQMAEASEIAAKAQKEGAMGSFIGGGLMVGAAAMTMMV